MASTTDNNTVVPAVVTTEPVSCPATENSSATSEGSQKVQSSLTHVAVLLLTLKTVYSLSESCVKALLLLMVVLIKVVGTAFGAKNADIKLFLAVFPTSEHSLRTIAGTNRGCEFSSTSVAQSAIRYTQTQDIQQGKTLEDENPSVLRHWVADVWKTGHVPYRC